MRMGNRGGVPVRIALLTEDQATFFITLMKNTDPVLEFKAALVVAFRAARERLAAGEPLEIPPPEPVALPEPEPAADYCPVFAVFRGHPLLRGIDARGIKHYHALLKAYAAILGTKVGKVSVRGLGPVNAWPQPLLDFCAEKRHEAAGLLGSGALSGDPAERARLGGTLGALLGTAEHFTFGALFAAVQAAGWCRELEEATDFAARSAAGLLLKRHAGQPLESDEGQRFRLEYFGKGNSRRYVLTLLD